MFWQKNSYFEHFALSSNCICILIISNAVRVSVLNKLIVYKNNLLHYQENQSNIIYSLYQYEIKQIYQSRLQNTKIYKASLTSIFVHKKCYMYIFTQNISIKGPNWKRAHIKNAHNEQSQHELAQISVHSGEFR